MQKSIKTSQTIIPTRIIGPIKIIGPELNAAIKVPLATYETPLWPSVSRGARISRACDGISAIIVSECMTRSIILEATTAIIAAEIATKLQAQQVTLETITTQTSQFCQLQSFDTQIIGNLLYLRFKFNTGNASGHNMTTKAADALCKFITEQHPNLKYVSISGNYCTDKKTSAVNGILGRGKYVIAEITIPREICKEHLHVMPEAIVNLNIKKNLLGSIAAGSLRSANAHFANMLLALYLATGQDAANIIEGSQGITHAELRNNTQDLYFSVTLPNLIIGTVGHGKHLAFVKENLELLGCNPDVQDNSKSSYQNSHRLALIIAATVLCGELSLLAAQVKPGELMKSHIKLER